MTDQMVIQIKSNGRGVVQPPPPRPHTEWRTLVYIVGGLLALVVLVGAGLLARAYISSQPEREASEETARLVSSVGLLMLLPMDEQPTVATVTNLESLKTQVFFKNARLGDKVLMYTKNRKAILYSPVENKIIEVAPLTFEEGN